jgi:hypothetical protein
MVSKVPLTHKSSDTVDVRKGVLEVVVVVVVVVVGNPLRNLFGIPYKA